MCRQPHCTTAAPERTMFPSRSLSIFSARSATRSLSHPSPFSSSVRACAIPRVQCWSTKADKTPFNLSVGIPENDKPCCPLVYLWNNLGEYFKEFFCSHFQYTSLVTRTFYWELTWFILSLSSIFVNSIITSHNNIDIIGSKSKNQGRIVKYSYLAEKEGVDNITRSMILSIMT